MRKFITIIIIIISVTAGVLFIKAMLELEKEASDYLDSRQNSTAKKSTEKEITDTESDKSNLDIDNEISGEDANRPNEDSKSPEASKDQKKLVVNTLYKDLFDELILNEEELDEFKDLIVDSQVFTSKNYDSSFKNKDEKTRELLGEQDYEVYEEFNETLVHRMKIMQYKQQLALSDSTLSEEQETDLLNIMLDEGSDKNTLEESREFLDTEQIEVLEKFQNTISNTDEMSIESLPEY